MKKYTLLLLFLITTQDTIPMQKAGGTALTSTALVKNSTKITPSLVHYYTARTYFNHNSNRYIAQNILRTPYVLSHNNYMRPYMQKRTMCGGGETIIIGGISTGISIIKAIAYGVTGATVATKLYNDSKGSSSKCAATEKTHEEDWDARCAAAKKEMEQKWREQEKNNEEYYKLFKVPGKPTKGDGFTPPKKGDGKLRPHPVTGQHGWPDKNGNWWVPSGTETQGGHGGAHWDLVYPDGRYDNVNPGGKIRPGNSGKYKSSKLPEKATTTVTAPQTQPTTAAPAKPQETTTTKPQQIATQKYDWTDYYSSSSTSSSSNSCTTSTDAPGSIGTTYGATGTPTPWTAPNNHPCQYGEFRGH